MCIVFDGKFQPNIPAGIYIQFKHNKYEFVFYLYFTEYWKYEADNQNKYVLYLCLTDLDYAADIPFPLT